MDATAWFGVALFAAAVALAVVECCRERRRRREWLEHTDSAIAVTQPAPDLALVDLALWELEMSDR